MPPEATSTNDELKGWKEIAAYLGTSVRTAQRWEERFGLPVNRIQAAGGAVISALRDDIDTWKRQKWAEAERDRVAHPEEGRVDPEWPAEGSGPDATPPTAVVTAPDDGANGPPTSFPPTPPRPARTASAGRSKPAWQWLPLAAALASLGVAWSLWHRGPQSESLGNTDPRGIRAVRTRGAPQTDSALDPGPWPTRGHDNRRSNASHLAGPASTPHVSLVYESAEPFPGSGMDLVVTSDGTILVGSTRTVIAISRAGLLRWEVPLARLEHDLFEQSRGFTVVPSAILVSTHDQPSDKGSSKTHLYRLATDGSVLATFVQTAAYAPPAVGPDGTVYQIDEFNMVAAYGESGEAKWRTHLSGFSHGAIAVDSRGNLHVATDGGVFNRTSYVSLSPGGEVRCSTGKTNLMTPVISTDDLVYMTDSEGTLYAYGDGCEERWRMRLPGTLLPEPLAIGSSGVLYAATSLGVTALTPQGRTLWQFPLKIPDTTRSSPGPVLDREENVYISLNDVVYRLSAATGAIQWSVLVDRVGRLVIGDEGVIYAIASGRRIYALSSAPVPIASAGGRKSTAPR